MERDEQIRIEKEQKEKEEHDAEMFSLGQAYEMDYTMKQEQEALQNRPPKKVQKIKLPETGFRVELTNDDGTGYMGTILIGSNQSPVKVLFDTGSDFLAITSSLCNDPSLGQQEKDEPVYDPVKFAYVPSGKDHRKCKSIAYDLN